MVKLYHDQDHTLSRLDSQPETYQYVPWVKTTHDSWVHYVFTCMRPKNLSIVNMDTLSSNLTARIYRCGPGGGG